MKMYYSNTLCCLLVIWGTNATCHAFLSPIATLNKGTVSSRTMIQNRMLWAKTGDNPSDDKAATDSTALWSGWNHLASAAFLVTTVLTTPLELAPSASTSSNINSSSREEQRIIHDHNNYRFEIRKSEAQALTEQQLLVTDVWKEVTRQYLDPTFNGLGEEKWKQKRLEAVKKVASLGPEEEEKLYESIRTMLNSLGDPYTRFLTPAQFEALTTYAKGDSAGVGVSLQADPRSGKVIVLNTLANGPADKAGVLPGDTIVEVDGSETNDAPAEVVAAKCRGPAGTNLNLAVKHADSDKLVQLGMTRASIQVNPVKSGTTNIKGKKLGLIQIASFSQETSKQVVEALRQLQKDSVNIIVLDVRGNAGGYMPAGVDVAKLFLPPKARVITEVDKSDRKTIEIADGIGSETNLPMYILVDKRTASASEILTAALQDNKRATVIGSSKTFGKGRIQNIQEMGDGSGIAVTKAKYITPLGNDIHGVGITPDVKSDSCGPEQTASDCLIGVL